MDTDKLKKAIASELIIIAMETKSKIPTQLSLDEMIDVVADVVNKISAYPALTDVSGRTGAERIICAAVWYKEIPIKKEIPFESTNPINCTTGLVFSGHRHGQCIYTKCAATGLRDAESGANEQGFLTSKNRFVSREEALIIALRENQVMDIKQIRGNRLFSEDLY